ncbi:MAG: AMP-binding protein [Anaerolineales bacterium]|nr:AMP-binding protein [Anaerolineales bacterium]
MNAELLERFPLITPDGAKLLRWLEEHPHAPKWTHPGVDRLSASAMAKAAEYALACQQKPPAWQAASTPDWLPAFLSYCYQQVPIYRRRGPLPENFWDVPTTNRADVAREPWSFVPDDVRVSGITVYKTSGTTGHPLSIITDGDTLALYLPLLQTALAAHGVTLDGGTGRVAVMVAAYQHQTYTYASVSAVLGQAGVVKINLHPTQWRTAADCAQFIAECQPEVMTGDPIAFAELARLPITFYPKALVSTAMALSAGLRQKLQAHFNCPVLDMYSMNESGPIAVKVSGVNLSGGHSGALTLDTYQFLQPQLFVEILDSVGKPCAEGERGEVTLTGGFNPYLPLVRYRTNDFARLVWQAGRPVLMDLEGRAPVVFRASDGRHVNNIDVSIALRHLPLAQFTLHQAADGLLTFRVRGTAVSETELRQLLHGVFGADAHLVFAPWVAEDKVVQYVSEVQEEN